LGLIFKKIMQIRSRDYCEFKMTDNFREKFIVSNLMSCYYSLVTIVNAKIWKIVSGLCYL